MSLQSAQISAPLAAAETGGPEADGPDAGEQNPNAAPGGDSAADHQQFAARLAAFEKFVARRFDEISMEINATSQQVDMAECGLKERFSHMLDVIEAITHHGDGASSANSGIELDSVMAKTEEATVKILDAAGRINIRLQNEEGLDDRELRAETLDAIRRDLDQIMIACSFQDLTSQRIQTTLERIKAVQADLCEAATDLGIEIDEHDNSYLAAPPGASQDDIDKLFD